MPHVPPGKPIRFYPRSGAVPSPGKIILHEGGKEGWATLEYYRDGVRYETSGVPYGRDDSGSDGPFWTLTTDPDPE